MGRERKCINANSCSRGNVTMGVGRSAEGLAPRPPNGRRRKNRKRRRISAAKSHGRNPPNPSLPDTLHPPIRCGLHAPRLPSAEDDGCSPAGPPCVFHTSGAASGPSGRAGGQDSLRPSRMSPIQLFFFFFFFFCNLSPRCAKDGRRHARRQFQGETEGSQTLRDGSGGRESFTVMLPLPGLVLRPLCFH